MYIRAGEVVEQIMQKKKENYNGEELNKAMAFRKG